MMITVQNSIVGVLFHKIGERKSRKLSFNIKRYYVYRKYRNFQKEKDGAESLNRIASNFFNKPCMLIIY